MALRRTAEFQNDKGIYYKLEIYDSSLGSPSTSTFQLGGSGFQLTYETQDRTRFSGVIPSNVSFDIVPIVGADQTLVDDIATASYGRFQLKILKSSDGTNYNNYWAGNILTDVSSRQNLSLLAGTQQTLTATDGLAELVDVSWKTGNSYTTGTTYRFLQIILNILRDTSILNTSQYWGATDNFISTQVNWYSAQMPTPAADKDPLHYSGIKPKALQKEENNQFVPIDAFDALNRIMKCWGARLFLSDGVWYITQPNGYADDNYQRNYRKGNTTLITSSSSQLVTNDGVVLGGGTFDSLNPVNQVQMYYDLLYSYQLLQFDIALWMTKVGPALQKTDPPTTTVNGGSSHSPTIGTLFSQSVGLVTGGTDAPTASLEWNLLFRPQLIYYDGSYLTNSTANASMLSDWNTSKAAVGLSVFAGNLKSKLSLRLKLVGDLGTTYYLYITSGQNGSTHEWVTNSVFSGYPHIFQGTLSDYTNPTSSSYNLQPRSGSSIGSQTGSLNAIPDSGELFIEGFARFLWVDTNGGYEETDQITSGDALYPDQTGSVIKGLAVGMNKPDGTDYYLRYLIDGQPTSQQLITATQGTAVSNVVLEIEPTNLGSGPTAQTPTRIITFDAAGNGDDGTATTWQVYQEATGDGETGSITKILCKEVLAGRKVGINVYNGSLQTDTTRNYEYYLAFTNFLSTKVFVPNQMTYNANAGIWEGQWIEANPDGTGQTYGSSDVIADTDTNANLTTEW